MSWVRPLIGSCAIIILVDGIKLTLCGRTEIIIILTFCIKIRQVSHILIRSVTLIWVNFHIWCELALQLEYFVLFFRVTAVFYYSRWWLLFILKVEFLIWAISSVHICRVTAHTKIISISKLPTPISCLILIACNAVRRSSLRSHVLNFGIAALKFIFGIFCFCGLPWFVVIRLINIFKLLVKFMISQYFHIIGAICVIIQTFGRKSVLSTDLASCIAVFGVMCPSLDHHHAFAAKHWGLFVQAVILLGKSSVLEDLVDLLLVVTSPVERFDPSFTGHIARVLSWLKLCVLVVGVVRIFVEVLFLHTVLTLRHPVDYAYVRHGLVFLMQGHVSSLLLWNGVLWLSYLSIISLFFTVRIITIFRWTSHPSRLRLLVNTKWVT